MSVLFIEPAGQTGKTYNPAKFDSTAVVKCTAPEEGEGHVVVGQIGEREIFLTQPLPLPVAERVHLYLLQYFQAQGGTIQMGILTDTARAAVEVDELRQRLASAEQRFVGMSQQVLHAPAVPTMDDLAQQRKALEEALVAAQEQSQGSQQGDGPANYDQDEEGDCD